MEIEILRYTENPVDLIGQAAGLCYGKDDPSEKRVVRCFKNSHGTPFEHATITFKVSGVSRVLSHQLVRHRIASYNQRSQRYCDEGGIKTKVPPSIKDNDTAMGIFYNAVIDACEAYDKLVAVGIPREDARFILPNGGMTELIVTFNCRTLYHFLYERDSKSAQWEIREMAQLLKEKISECDPQWGFLIDLIDKEEGLC